MNTHLPLLDSKIDKHFSKEMRSFILKALLTPISFKNYRHVISQPELIVLSLSAMDVIIDKAKNSEQTQEKKRGSRYLVWQEPYTCTSHLRMDFHQYCQQIPLVLFLKAVTQNLALPEYSLIKRKMCHWYKQSLG